MSEDDGNRIDAFVRAAEDGENVLGLVVGGSGGKGALITDELFRLPPGRG